MYSSEQIKYTPERGFYNELLNFYNTLNGTEEISVTPEIEYGDVKMVFDILESISSKNVIYVDSPSPIKNIDLEETQETTSPYIQ